MKPLDAENQEQSLTVAALSSIRPVQPKPVLDEVRKNVEHGQSTAAAPKKPIL